MCLTNSSLSYTRRVAGGQAWMAANDGVFTFHCHCLQPEILTEKWARGAETTSDLSALINPTLALFRFPLESIGIFYSLLKSYVRSIMIIVLRDSLRTVGRLWVPALNDRGSSLTPSACILGYLNSTIPTPEMPNMNAGSSSIIPVLPPLTAPSTSLPT